VGYRKVALKTGCYYHIFTRSIAGFEVFRYREEYLRFLETFRFYQCERPILRFSKKDFLRERLSSGPDYVRLIAYCIMPTHVHFILEQLAEAGISECMRLTLNSYARYFNEKSGRKGPLWESRFQNRLIETDEYALHLSRYIHLNPTSAGLVTRPEDWEFSSYREYLGLCREPQLCEFIKIIPLSADRYRKFAEDHADHQRTLQVLKAHLID